jgi:hypothetical protein
LRQARALVKFANINPYSMGAGNPPPALTGREAQEQQFRTLLARLRGGLSDRSARPPMQAADWS